MKPAAAAAWPAAGLTALVVAGLYFGFFNHDFSVNGMNYARDVERGVALFHPNHLLPNVLYRGAYRLAQAFGAGSLRAIWLMQAINVCAGVSAAAAIAVIARVHTGTRAAVLVGVLYAVGFAAWNFAEEPDVYVLPAAAVCVSMALLAWRDALSWRSIGALGALAVFAVLTLQQYVFWYPALLFLVARRNLGAARRGKLLALAIGIPLACFAAYVAAALWQGQLHTWSDALGAFLGYAWDAQRGFGTYRPAPSWTARLAGVMLGSGNLVFAWEAAFSTLALIAVPVALVSLAHCAWRTIVSLRTGAAVARSDALIVLAWGAANLVFAAWWEARNIEFLLPVWIAFCVALALAAPALNGRALALAVLLIGGVNLTVAFAPERDWPPRYRVAAALAQHEQLRAGDVLVTEELNTVDYLHYFEHVDVRFLPGAVSAAMHTSQSVAQARAELDRALATGARVYTTEPDEQGRLHRLAAVFGVLGRADFDGGIERDIAQFYRGLDISEQPVPGVRRVRAAADGAAPPLAQ